MKTIEDLRFPHQQITRVLIGFAMDVHRNLGRGILEIVYKDAFELELKMANVVYQREKAYEVRYKGVVLPHKFYADFVAMDKIIVEIKAQKDF